MICLSSKGSLHQTNGHTVYFSHKVLTNYEGISGKHCSSVLHIKDFRGEMPDPWVFSLSGEAALWCWEHHLLEGKPIKNVFIFLAESTLMVSSIQYMLCFGCWWAVFYSKITIHLFPPWSFVNQPREVYQENKRISDIMPGNQDLWLTYRKVCSIAYGKN